MMLDERHIRLLKALVRQYVESAEPVGSVFLAEAAGLNLSPATIRSLLRDLEEAGFLEQPHTSAGRKPTDRGYRFVIDHSPAPIFRLEELRKIAQQFEQLNAEYQHLARTTSKLLARLSQAAAVSGFLNQREIQEAGMPEVLRQPEANHAETVREISSVMEDVDHLLPALADNTDHAVVYIGQENPFFPARYTSLVVRTVTTPDEQVVLAVVGPKRMPYQRNMAFVNALATIVRDHERKYYVL